MIHHRELRSIFACLLLLGLVFGMLFQHSPARADIAPPEFPPGSNLQPGVENTYVQMVSEVVTLSVMKESAQYQFARASEPREVGQARVNAVFVMRNQGQAAELLEVRFPLATLRGDGWFGYPEIFDLSVKVDGSRVATQRIEKTVPADQRPEAYAGPWAAFSVSFPVGEDVRIELNYTDYGATESPISVFGYILETGAGWHGAIGSADIILRLPYPANAMNVLIDQTTSGGTTAGNEMRWHYTDLEPSTENNLEFTIVLPKIWNQVIIETENVTRNPRDGEAWGRLGKAYKETLYQHGRPRCWEGHLPEAYPLSYEAYAKAVELLPEDGLWHYGFADLIWYNAGFCHIYAGTGESEAEKQRFGEELRLALDLAPDYEALRYLDMEVRNVSPDFYNQYVLQHPTPTPTVTLTPTAAEIPLPTPLPANTLPPTPTAVLSSSPTPTAADVVIVEDTAIPLATPTPKPSGGTAICAGAALIPFLVVVLALGRKKRS